MDAKELAKAREAGEAPEEVKAPPVSKKCFLFLVLILLTGGIVAIVYVLKSDKPPPVVEVLTTTTARPTTVPIALLLNDEDVLARCKKRYTAVLGDDAIGLLNTGIKHPKTKEELKKGAFWLRGVAEEDKISFKQIRIMACRGFIPTVVIQIRPQGYRIMMEQGDLVHYEGDELYENWEDYDTQIAKYINVLGEIPSIVILEPKLLQLTYNIKNLQYDYENGMYLEEFIKRAQLTTNSLKKSWTYIDVGDANWLTESGKHLDHVASILLRLQGIRGFAMNTGFFANTTYVEKLARKITCQTDLNYVIDTGRNGGEFSQQEIEKVAACRFDPPNIKSGNKPQYGYAASKAAQKLGRRKRSIFDQFKSLIRERRGIYDTGLGSEPQRESNGWSNGLLSPAEKALLAAAAGNGGGGFPRLKIANKGSEKKSAIRKTGRIFAKTVRAPSSAPKPVLKSAKKMAGKQITGQIRAKAQANPPKPAISVKKGLSVKSLTKAQAEEKMNRITFKNKHSRCFSENSKMTRMDAFVWTRSAGESDGRVLTAGTFDGCLLTHKLECDGTCGLIVNPSCSCLGPVSAAVPYGAVPYGPPVGMYPGYAPNPYPQPYPYQG